MALTEWASRIVKAAIPIQDIISGPWRGAMESRPADRIPREYAAGVGSTNFLYLPRSGTWKRRGGQEIRFDAFGSQVGLLPAKWLSSSTSTYCKARQMEEFVSDMVTDNIPTVMALVTKETIESGLDDGWFSNVYVRDQVTSANYTLGSEYSSTTYPTLGSEQTYRVVPLWYESGDGGITRGTTEFLRRFLVSGSRRFLKVGNWWYFPSLKGTPARWSGLKGGAGSVSESTFQCTTTSAFDAEWFATTASDTLTSDGDTSFIGAETIATPPTTITSSITIGLNAVVAPSGSSWTVNYNARITGAVTVGTATFTIYDSAGIGHVSAAQNIVTGWSTTYADLTAACNSTSGTGTANSLKITLAIADSGGAGEQYRISYISVTGPTTVPGTVMANRLIPSGPLPPTHAGSLAKGTTSTPGSSPLVIYPDADITDGDWLNSAGNATAMYSYIDEVTLDTADYITSATIDEGISSTCTIGLGDFGFEPEQGSQVTVNYNAAPASLAGATSFISLRVDLMEGSTVRGTGTATFFVSTSDRAFSYTLTDTQIDEIEVWTNLSLKFTAVGRDDAGSSLKVRVRQANVSYRPAAGAAEGSWLGKDRFFYSVAYRFEDGSVWAPCTPRMPSSTLTSGFNLFTLDSANPDTQYDFVTWSNIPIGPHGVVGRILLRTPKVDSTVAGDELKLNPFDFRVVWEITDNTTTTYTDSQADDTGLYDDAAGLFVRYDYIMPPRARYIAGGDMRIVHAYGGQNPCAIQIAPVGRTADYDLNLLDSSTTAYTSHGSFMRYRIETDGNATLRLVQGDGATATDTKTLDMDDYATLQALVDAINATTAAADGQQWRAQLCPGVNPAAPSKTALTPHIREIASVVCTSGTATLTKAAGGLSAVAVGSLISKSDVTVGTYVKRIDSDTQLTMSANATGTSTGTASFHVSLGDTAITGELGWQRVIANSLPGFLYFAESYLDDDPVDKSSVWMTTATPGSMRSAANNFSGKPANRFKPPTNAGISMGGAAVDQGFVLPFSGGVFALKNTRDASTGIDEDYKLVELNANRGCIAWNTVTPGNRFVPYLTAEGMCAADLEQEFLISDELWLHAPSTGNLSYEIPLCIAATAKDDDTAYASCKVMRSAIWLNYRTSASTTHPNSQAVLDFSTGYVSNGLGALFSKPGDVWGWSTRLVRSVTAMCEGRRSDGGHLYGWNELNAGSTGGGRIDEIEYGDTDNTTAISAAIIFPWERMGQHFKLSAQEVILEHTAPSGATVLLDFHRSYSDTTYTLTPSTTALVVGREVKFLPQAARVPTAACYIGYRQTAGGAAELRAFTLRAKSIPSYT